MLDDETRSQKNRSDECTQSAEPDQSCQCRNLSDITPNTTDTEATEHAEKANYAAQSW